MKTYTDNYDERLAQELLRKQGILKQILLQWLQVLELKIQVYRERQHLRAMSDIRLNDLGITRTEAAAEAARRDIPVERLDALSRQY
jgi:uncharacterized protein YjiS (DUF1127 family)